MLSGWRYWYRRYLGWFPIQFCMICGGWYWGGLPTLVWQAWMQDYCSRKCADAAILLELTLTWKNIIFRDMIPVSPHRATIANMSGQVVARLLSKVR